MASEESYFEKLIRFMRENPEPVLHETRHVTITLETLNTKTVYDILEPVFLRMATVARLEEHEPAMAAFSQAQRILYAVWCYHAEVFNGGHHQFYSNSSGMLWPDARAGLEMLGAHSTKEILLESVRRFPEPPSLHRGIRGEQLDRVGLKAFDDLDTRFYGEKVDLEGLMLAWIRSHPNEFLFSGSVIEEKRLYKLDYDNGRFQWVLKATP